MSDSATLQSNLEGKQQGEQKLVIFIQPSARVAEHLQCQVVNDVFDTFVGYGRPLRPMKSTICYVELYTITCKMLTCPWICQTVQGTAVEKFDTSH